MKNINVLGSPCNNLVIFIAAFNYTSCTISAPKYPNFKTKITTVNPADVAMVELPQTLSLERSGVHPKGIAVSCNSTVTLNGLNTCPYSTDGFLAIPNNHLGRKYYAFTVSPQGKAASQIAVVTFTDNTEVRLELSSYSESTDVIYNGLTFQPGDTIVQTLDAYECLLVQSKGDLSGTLITSSELVACFSGNDKTKISRLRYVNKDHLVMQLPPINSWGQRFAVVPTPVRTKGNHIYVMASENDTLLTFNCKNTNTDISRNLSLSVPMSEGNMNEAWINSLEYCYIETNKPVLVVQAMLGTVFDNSSLGGPSILCLPSIDQFSNDYVFKTPMSHVDSGFYNFFVYVVKGSEVNRLMLNGVSLTTSNYIPSIIPGTSLMGGYFLVIDGLHHISHPYEEFSGVLVGSGQKHSYSFPLGGKLMLKVYWVFKQICLCVL